MFGNHHLSFVVTEYSGTFISGCTTVKLRLQGSVICFFCSTSRPSVIVSIVDQWTFLDYVFRAYDKAALQCNGKEAVTNFDASIYGDELIPGADNGGTIPRNPDIYHVQNDFYLNSWLMNFWRRRPTYSWFELGDRYPVFCWYSYKEQYRW